MRRIVAAALSASIAATVAGMAIGQQNIGVVASIDPNLRGTPPGQSQRTLQLGTGVFLDETIRSSASGRGQLMFNDETTLTIAPQSVVTLDTFVYDPARKRGQIGLGLATGTLRFIGGQTTKTNEAVIRTPTTTIGIRGSSALVQHVNGQTIAVFLMGDRMCYGTGGSRSCTSRQGGVLGENGFLGVISQESLVALLTQIDGQPPTSLQAGGRTGTNPQTGTQVTRRTDPVSTRGARSQPRVAATGGGRGSGQFPDPLLYGPLGMSPLGGGSSGTTNGGTR
ncbi:MAG: FecR domain-containing protein [Pseudomonadota bacterium]